MSKILVTGGAGFIGSHIVDALLGLKHEVLVLDDLSSGRRENLPPGQALVKLDLRSAEARAFLAEEKPEVVVHAAAQMSVSCSMEDPHFDVDVNVLGLLNFLQLMRKDYSPHFVFLSTGGAIYGEQESFPAAEDHPIRPTSVYGLSKRVSELYLDFWQRSFGLRCSVLRLANVYGPRQNPHGEAGVVAIFCQKFLQGVSPTIFGDGEQTRDFIYVSDVVSALLKAIGQEIRGIFNIGSGKETSVNKISAELQKVLETKVKPNYAAARAGEQRRSVILSTKAKQELAWQPEIGLTQGLKLTAEWFAASKLSS